MCYNISPNRGPFQNYKLFMYFLSIILDQPVTDNDVLLAGREFGLSVLCQAQ